MSVTPEVTPPKWADRFLEWFCRPDRLEQIQGDLHELYFIRMDEYGARKARLAFVWDILRTLRAENIKKNKTQNNSAMIMNYLKVGWRSLKGQKIPSFINVFGLSCAIACCIVAYMFVSNKLHRDRFHTNSEDIYMLTHTESINGESVKHGTISEVVGEHLLNEVSDFKFLARMSNERGLVKRGNDIFFETVLFVDSDFHEMFDFPLEYGSLEELKKKDRIAITPSKAEKYFGSDFPIGNEMQISIGGETRTFIVGAIIAPAPENSTIHFDILLHIEMAKEFKPNDELITCAFVQLAQSIDDSDLEGLNELVALNNGINSGNSYTGLQLKPLKQINSNAEEVRGGLGHTNNPAPIIVLSTIGILLLALAIFNYLNIAIMMASRRIKEIGTRKVIGARRNHIIIQFLVENLIVCSLALLVGVFIATNFFLPWFNELSNGNHRINFLDANIWYFLSVVLVVIGLSSGGYPAWFISSFNSSAIFKGTEQRIKKSAFTSALLVFQFSIAMLTMMASIVFIQTNQVNQNRDWGYQHESKLVVNTPTHQDYTLLKNRFMSHPDVLTLAGNKQAIGSWVSRRSMQIGEEQHNIKYIEAESNYPKVMGLRLEEGRFFENSSQTDLETSIIVNNTFMKEHFLELENNPKITIDSSTYHIVGVVQDFHYHDFGNDIDPLVIAVTEEENFEHLTLEVFPGTEIQMYDELKSAYHAQISDHPFYGFIQSNVFDEYFIEAYSISDLLTFTASLAIILSIMGLYGLVSLTISNSMKAFSIKKILGANTFQLSSNIYKRFIYMLSISTIIGGLFGSQVIAALLDNVYRYHENLSVFHVLSALVILSSVVLFTISVLIKNMQRTNPADILRIEQ